MVSWICWNFFAFDIFKNSSGNDLYINSEIKHVTKRNSQQLWLTDTQNFFTAQLHEEFRELLDTPLSSFIHLFNFIINTLHELFQHEFCFDLLFILIPKKHSLAISLFWLNPLKYIIQKRLPFLLGASLRLNDIIKFFEMGTFPHSHLDLNI